MARHSRYTDNMLRHLGLNPESRKYASGPRGEALTELCKSAHDAVVGKFENILRLLYTSDTGSLENNLQEFMTASTPQIVKDFVQQVLMADIPSMRAAPDDETAFATIIPREFQTYAEFTPYAEHIKEFISQSRLDFQQSQQSQQQPQTE